jgi:flagellar biosynthesis/type III secretory pathway protein FliH
MLMTEFNIDTAKEVWQEEAHEKGLQKGLQEGKAEGLMEVARNLKNLKNMPAGEISQLTGLPLSVIEKL